MKYVNVFVAWNSSFSVFIFVYGCLKRWILTVSGSQEKEDSAVKWLVML